MNRAKIKKIEIQGFRAFGKSAQTLDYNSLIASVWGPNSQGKTSLAEAFEFVLTGQISRRGLLASAQDEFAGALRNVHMPESVPTFVQLTIECGGKLYTARRTLTSDYGRGKNPDCQSVLTIDGKAATEVDLTGVGVVLSQAPLRTPVLAQHTLGYLFSAKPQDRTTYFRALLEVGDLEVLRAAVAKLDDFVKTPENPLLDKLAQAILIPAAADVLEHLNAKVPSIKEAAAAIQEALAAILSAEGHPVPSTLAECSSAVETLLSDKQTRTFPIRGFDKSPVTKWVPSMDGHVAALAAYLTERAKVDEETRRLAAFFAEALALPHVRDASHPIDCPLCATPSGLTPERIGIIRQRVRDTEVFRASEKAAAKAVEQLQQLVESIDKVIEEGLPRFIVYPAKARRQRGFRIERVRALLGPETMPVVASWLRALRPLTRSRVSVARCASENLAALASYKVDLNTLAGVDVLVQKLTGLKEKVAKYEEFLTAYVAAEEPVAAALRAVVDAESKTTGWQSLVDLAADAAGLRAALVKGAAVQQVRKEIEQALRQIDRGNEKVLEEKFQVLSADVEEWWNLLRPDGVSFFSAVRPRPGTRRTIDFKAGLSVSEDRANPTLRDVIAVFSQSQLHCLGLALFIARSVHERTGFIILDDPILSSDEDYRAHFNSAVLEKLISLGVQVILLTQDQKTHKDLGERYLHVAIDTFQINFTNPAEGTSVVNKADDLAALLSKAEVLIRGGHPDLHKRGGEVLRDAAERFCKEVLVKDRRSKGETTAAISDYDGKNLGEISPRTEPLMALDASHPGKLRTIGLNLNPANHDDSIPGAGVLKVALGDLKALRRTYIA